jgi:hypothetical protein
MRGARTIGNAKGSIAMPADKVEREKEHHDLRAGAIADHRYHCPDEGSPSKERKVHHRLGLPLLEYHECSERRGGQNEAQNNSCRSPPVLISLNQGPN